MTETEQSETKAPDPETPEAKPETVQPPAWAVFRPGETIPLKGINWRVAGYSKNWEVVLQPVGYTGNKKKEMKRREGQRGFAIRSTPNQNISPEPAVGPTEEGPQA